MSLKDDFDFSNFGDRKEQKPTAHDIFDEIIDRKMDEIYKKLEILGQEMVMYCKLGKIQAQNIGKLQDDNEKLTDAVNDISKFYENQNDQLKRLAKILNGMNDDIFELKNAFIYFKNQEKRINELENRVKLLEKEEF